MSRQILDLVRYIEPQAEVAYVSVNSVILVISNGASQPADLRGSQEDFANVAPGSIWNRDRYWRRIVACRYQ